MEHGAVVDRRREVRRVAAAGGEVERRAGQIRPSSSKPIDVAGLEIVALAGQDHVVVAVEAELGGAAGPARRRARRRRRIGRGWLSLPPKPPPMRRTSTDDGVVAQAEHLGDVVLHLGRVLGRGVDVEVAVLAGDGHGDLAFEIEVVLSADGELAAQPVRRGGDGAAATSPSRMVWAGSMTVPAARASAMVEDAGQVFVGDLRQAAARRLRRGFRRRRRTATGRRTGPGRRRRADHRRATGLTSLVAGNVLRADDSDDAGRGADGGQVQRDDAGVGAFADAETDMEQVARLGDVVDVAARGRRRGVSALSWRTAVWTMRVRSAMHRLRVQHADGLAPRLGEQAAQQVLRHGQAIGGRGAHVVERLEVAAPARRRPPRWWLRSTAGRSAPLRRLVARFGVPPCRRRRGGRCRRRRPRWSGKAPQTAEMSWSKRLESLVRAEERAGSSVGTIDRVTISPGRGPACRRRGRNPRAACRAVAAPVRSTSVAPSAIRAGGMSPIGEPLAMLPTIVPLLRTCAAPRRRISSPSDGCRSASVASASL